MWSKKFKKWSKIVVVLKKIDNIIMFSVKWQPKHEIFENRYFFEYMLTHISKIRSTIDCWIFISFIWDRFEPSFFTKKKKLKNWMSRFRRRLYTFYWFRRQSFWFYLHRRVDKRWSNSESIHSILRYVACIDALQRGNSGQRRKYRNFIKNAFIGAHRGMWDFPFKMINGFS